MSEFNRNYGPPLIVLLGIAVMIGLAAIRQHYGQPPNSNYSTQHNHGVSSPSTAPVVVLSRKQSPSRANPYSSRAEYRQEKDLQAQRHMAKGTIWIAVFTVLMTLITGMGVILIGRTLKATNKGLRYMRETLTQAEKTTDAANRTVDVTREIGAAELQPYPIIKSGGRVKIHNSATGMAFVVEVPIMNGGKSPMYDVKVRLDVYLWQGGPNVPPQANKIPEPALAEFACLAPDDVAVYPAQTAGTRDYISAVFNNEADWDSDGDSLSLAIECTVISKDWHGQPVRTFSAWMAAKSPVNLKDYPPFNFEVELYHPRTNLERPAYL